MSTTNGNEIAISDMRDQVNLALEQQYVRLSVFTDGLPWDRDRYIKRARNAFHEHVKKGYEAGDCLIVLYNMCDHGEFMAALNEIEIPYSTAKNYMAASAGYHKLPADIVNTIGRTKVYMLLKAPDDELKKFQETGKFYDIDKDIIVQLSTRELGERIKEATGKLKFDLDNEKVAKEKLFDEKRTLEAKLKRVEAELNAARTGQQDLPVWYHQATSARNVLSQLAQTLELNPPDLNDLATSKRCEMVLQRIETELSQCRKHLTFVAFDTDEVRSANARKVEQIDKEGKFDWTPVDEIQPETES